MKVCSRCKKSEYIVWDDVKKFDSSKCSECLAEYEWYIYIQDGDVAVRPAWYQSHMQPAKIIQDVRCLYKNGRIIQFVNVSGSYSPYIQISNEDLAKRMGILGLQLKS